MNKCVRLSLAAAIFAIPVLAQAVPMTVITTGVITESRDDLNLFGFGNAMDSILGAEITSTWFFDTDNLGPDINTFPESAYYFAETNSVSSSIQILKGAVTSEFRLEDALATPDSHQDSVTVEDEYALFESDGYSISDVSRRGTGDIASNGFLIRTEDDWFDSILANQNLSTNLTNLFYPFNAGGFYYFLGNDRGYANYSVSSFSIMPTPAQVPEPAGVFLLLFGAGGLAATRRLKKAKL